MPGRPAKYSNFSEERSSVIETNVHVKVKCPYCSIVVAQISEESLSKRKTQACKKHIRACPTAPADQVEAALEKRKRREGDSEGKDAATEDAAASGENAESTIEVLNQTVATLRTEKAQLQNELDTLKLSFSFLEGKRQHGEGALTGVSADDEQVIKADSALVGAA